MSKAQFIAEFLQPEELYAGMILDNEGDYHVVVSTTTAPNVSWDYGHIFAAMQGGQLPTRREIRLILINLPDLLKGIWFWSCEKNPTLKDSAYAIATETFAQGYDRFAADVNVTAISIRRIPLTA